MEEGGTGRVEERFFGGIDSLGMLAFGSRKVQYLWCAGRVCALVASFSGVVFSARLFVSCVPLVPIVAGAATSLVVVVTVLVEGECA